MEQKRNIYLSSSNLDVDDSGSKVTLDNKTRGNIHIIDETKNISEETPLKETLEKHDKNESVPGNLSSQNLKSSCEYAFNESIEVIQNLDCQNKSADESKTSRQNRNDNAEQCICETQNSCDSHHGKDEIITGSCDNSGKISSSKREPVDILKKGLNTIFVKENRASLQNKYRDFNPFDSKPKKRVNNDIVLEEDSADCENESAKSVEKTSDDCKDFCDFCDNLSRFMCTSCKFFYCEKCLNQLHPAVGPFRSHKVVPADNENRNEHEKCVEHGLVVQLYCDYCEQKRCPECARTKCHLHFKGRISNFDLEREKTVLVEDLEKATSKLAFVEKYKEKVQDELGKTAMTGLLRREQIRQEFLSFHDLLVEKEEKMLIQLEEDMQERLNHIRDTLQASVASIEREDAKLTAAVTDLVQSTNDENFIEEYVKAKDLCQQVDKKIKEFDKTWAKNSTYKCSRLLDNHFSMFIEKKELSDDLSEFVEEESQLVFSQRTLYIDDISRPLQIFDYLQIPKSPPSTQVIYTVQAFAGGKLLYETDTKNLQDVQLNTQSTLIFNCGNRFLLKVTPVFKCTISSQKYQIREGQPAYMFIVVAYLFQAETDTKDFIHAKLRSPAQRKVDDSQVLKELVRHNNKAKMNPSFKKLKINVGKKSFYLKKILKTARCEENKLNKEMKYRKGAGISKQLVMTKGAKTSKEMVMAKEGVKRKELHMTKEAGISKELHMTKEAVISKELAMKERKQEGIQNTTRCIKKAVRRIRR